MTANATVVDGDASVAPSLLYIYEGKESLGHNNDSEIHFQLKVLKSSKVPLADEGFLESESEEMH